MGRDLTGTGSLTGKKGWGLEPAEEKGWELGPAEEKGWRLGLAEETG